MAMLTRWTLYSMLFALASIYYISRDNFDHDKNKTSSVVVAQS